MNAVQQRQLQRFLFLKYLYDTTGGSTLRYIPLPDVAQALGVTLEEAADVLRYLLGEKLITNVTGPSVALTHRGVVEVEAKLTEPNTPTQHFPMNVINIGQAFNSPIQQGTVGSTQLVSFSSTDLQAVSLAPRFEGEAPRLGVSS